MLLSMPLGRRLAGELRRLAGRALDAVLPPRCLGCGGAVDLQGALCPDCWRRLTFLGPPQCACCGLPFEFEVGAGARCGACHADPPAFARARAVLAYDAGSRELILGFKHADRTYAAPPFGRWLARSGVELLADAELIAPVPLHRRRLWQRRYNQSALLALALGKAAGLPVAADLLVRHRATPSQAGRSRTARRRNVQGAFSVRPSRRGAVPGRRILLVDDVLTTGATVHECARVLRRAGAAAVDVITLARVVRPGGWH